MVLEAVHIVRSISTTDALIELRSDDIVRVLFKENFTMDIPKQESLVQEYIKLCEGRKYPFLFEAMDNVSFTKEARDNAANLEKISPSLATAAIATSLPYRLIANFYLKFNKPKIPFKVFRRQEDAIKWLRTFNEK